MNIGSPQLRKHQFRAGKLHPNWKGGVTPVGKLIRSSEAFKNWREAIFKRDGFHCVRCGIKSDSLHPHHIKRLSEIVLEFNLSSFAEALLCEILWDIKNGETLCVDCHGKEHNRNFKPRGQNLYVCSECQKEYKRSNKNKKKGKSNFCSRFCQSSFYKKNHKKGLFKKGVFYPSSYNIKAKLL